MRPDLQRISKIYSRLSQVTALDNEILVRANLASIQRSPLTKTNEGRQHWKGASYQQPFQPLLREKYTFNKLKSEIHTSFVQSIPFNEREYWTYVSLETFQSKGRWLSVVYLPLLMQKAESQPSVVLVYSAFAYFISYIQIQESDKLKLWDTRERNSQPIFGHINRCLFSYLLRWQKTWNETEIISDFLNLKEQALFI